jgi:G:T-mismatch repair DNA endonuclease (very short patch repair protein)
MPLNRNKFIEKATEIHNKKYNYSEVVFINGKTKVIIICPIHKGFEQRPYDHLKGHGCRKCGNEKNANKNRSNTDEFKLEATEIHEDKYDYSKVVYIDSTTKVIIICKIHGEFEQAPSGHLQGAGCNQCAIETNTNNLKSNTDEFIKKAIKKYGDKYDYSKVEYIASREKVIIICKTHGEFEQRPTDHLSGYGCYRCSYSKQFSNTQIKWLQFLSVYYNIQIQHAENDTEYKIQNTRYKADGYCKETNTIYEFHGDFWHGNPNLFKENEYNKKTKCTFGELYQKTLEKEQTIKNLGYNLVTIWESDWKQINKIISVIQKKIKNYKSIRLL